MADIVQKRWDKKLSSGKIKSLVEKYKQPQNCSDRKGIKVYPEIWSQLTAKRRKTDPKDIKFTTNYPQTTFATLQTRSMLINNSSVPDNNKIMAQQVDTIAMLRHVNTQLAQLRKGEIKQSLKAEYSAICSSEVPISSQYLFVDDLAKQLRYTKEASKISYSVASTSKSGPHKGKQRSSNQLDRYNKGPKKDFFMERPQSVPRKEKIAKQQEKVMDQLLQIKDEVSGFKPFLPTLLTYLQY